MSERKTAPGMDGGAGMSVTLKLKRDAMTGKDAALLTSIGYALEYGTVFRQDCGKARKVYEIAAEKGSGAAWNNLGFLYEEGHGVARDAEKAREYFLKSVRYEDTTAMVNLGNLYEYGLLEGGVDYGKAYYWYREAAVREDKTGIFNCANLMFWGRGVEKNRNRAFRIYSWLFRRGYPGCAYPLGICYEDGDAVEQDYEKARYYYRMGALEDSRYCYDELGLMYLMGLGVEKDPELAMEYFLRAVELGSGPAAGHIGHMYEAGDGLEQDPEKARYWYSRGAEMADEASEEALARLKEDDSAPEEDLQTENGGEEA